MPTSLRVTGGVCLGDGCNYQIEPGLDLKFCPECRLKQPIPTENRASTQDVYNARKRRERQDRMLAELLEA